MRKHRGIYHTEAARRASGAEGGGDSAAGRGRGDACHSSRTGKVAGKSIACENGLFIARAVSTYAHVKKTIFLRVCRPISRPYSPTLPAFHHITHTFPHFPRPAPFECSQKPETTFYFTSVCVLERPSLPSAGHAPCTSSPHARLRPPTDGASRVAHRTAHGTVRPGSCQSRWSPSA